MKLPKFPKKKPKPRDIAFIALMAAILCYSLSALFAGKDPEQKHWSYAALPFTQEVSLSQATNILKEAPEGRRAAVLGKSIVIEVVPGAGNAPLQLMDDYKEWDEAKKEAWRQKAELASEAREETEVDEETAREPYEVITPEIELDVIRATVTSYYSGLLDDFVQNSEFDIQILSDPDLEGVSGADIADVLFIGFIILIAIIFIVSISGRGNFGTSKSFDVIKPEDLKIGLDDVAGIGIAKGDIAEVVEFLKNPKEASRLGGRMPRGALFDGPPGTGKTLLAKAVAKEAGVTFISVDASSLSALYVGLGAIKARAIFKKARKMAPCILFIDEIDAMAKRRDGSSNAGSDEKANTLNAILTELDGFESRDGIFVIGATNRPEVLDPALTRPGRIDRRITMTVPDITGRCEILEVHTRNKVLADDIDLKSIAGSTYGLTGAELENLVNEAALNAPRHNRDAISQEDLRYGRDRVLLPRASSQITLMQDDRHLTAVHEAGHAVIAVVTDHSDPIEKATILPQGNALGFVMQAPDRDFVFHSKARLKDRIRVAVAGRAAETLIFGEEMVTTGAASDIQQATAVARAMVTQYGMSEAGFVQINPQDPVLCETQGEMLRMVKEIITKEQSYVDELLSKYRGALDAVTQELLDRETMSGDEVRQIVAAHSA